MSGVKVNARPRDVVPTSNERTNGLRHNKLSSAARSSSSRSRHQQLIVRAQNQSSSSLLLCVHVMLFNAQYALKRRKKTHMEIDHLFS